MSLSEKIKYFLVGWLGATLLRTLMITVRIHVEGKEIDARLHRVGPVIYAFWHGRLVVPTLFRQGQGARTLISRHRDGEYIAQIARRLGHQPVRGSSTRGGSAALRALSANQDGTADLAITPDGPRGPRYVAQRGTIFLGQKSGLPILPIAIGMRRYWQLPSWDEFRIPKPFSHVLFKFVEPLYIPRVLSSEEMEAYRLKLQEMLREATAYADRKVLEWD